AKPRWSATGEATEMLPPELGRRLTDEERVALDACRACLAKDPARRVATAADAGRLLTQRQAWWARRPAGRRSVVFAGALAVAAAVAVGVALVRVQRGAQEPRAAAPSDSPMIAVTGRPADWTDLSAVMAEVSDRIHCLRLLPDQRTLRFVWGMPA